MCRGPSSLSTPSSSPPFCLGVWECLLFLGGGGLYGREKEDQPWVWRILVLSSRAPLQQAGVGEHWGHRMMIPGTASGSRRPKGDGGKGLGARRHSLAAKRCSHGSGGRYPHTTLSSILEAKGEIVLEYNLQTHSMCQPWCEAILQKPWPFLPGQLLRQVFLQLKTW